MSDYSSILNMLVDLEKTVEAIKDELGKLQAQADVAAAGMGITGRPAVVTVIPPSGTEEIVGGQETSEFPDCCAIGDDQGYKCTGTLIAPNVVVTADHCEQVTRVFLSGTDISKPEEGETLRVVRQLSHPEVDLKVLVLAKDSQVKPRHVAQGAEVTGAAMTMLVGFGTIDIHGRVGYGIKRRLAVEIPITSLACTEPSDPKKYGCLHGREMVAGHRGLLLDTCHGDSGGPLYIRGASGEYYLLGTTSRGVRNGFTNCGDGGIYVRIDLCLDWIRSVTGVEIEGPRI